MELESRFIYTLHTKGDLPTDMEGCIKERYIAFRLNLKISGGGQTGEKEGWNEKKQKMLNCFGFRMYREA